jgi:hypothetical protein
MCTLTPAIRTPLGIRFDGPAEGASAIAAQSTSTSDGAARFQSYIRTNEAATRFTSRMSRPKLDSARDGETQRASAGAVALCAADACSERSTVGTLNPRKPYTTSSTGLRRLKKQYGKYEAVETPSTPEM